MTTTGAGELELKGAAFFGMLTCVEKLHGAQGRAAVMKALPAHLEERVRTRTMLVGGWYPATWYRELLAGVDIGFGVSRPESS